MVAEEIYYFRKLQDSSLIGGSPSVIRVIGTLQSLDLVEEKSNL